ncbi:DUF559 domain-containing protein [Plantactinospora sp. KBS50]|uniref:DUF559 domain-containing protein n=1 Tax=Plantactinospora sp. KBS50 TaxID=2024580 RepID=UPI000BAAAD23|nr:DUF559 domain-containing protein [Plantactinospora sp. KBS50]ASW53647.1 hypothetical protein CIK06_04740 [Plantactinospora sp. KBS50]
MSQRAAVPRGLGFLPFRGTRAIADGLLSRRMLAGRGWRRLLPDVYIQADAFAPDDHRMWCDAVALVLPADGAIGGPSAAFLWGADLLPRGRTGAPVSVVVARSVRIRRHPAVRITHTRLDAGDVVRFAGLPVTSAARTAFDLGRRGPRADAVVAVDALLRRRVVRPAALNRYALARPGWRGARLLREVLPLAEPLAESPMETRLRLLLVDAGLPQPVAQYEVRDGLSRWLARVDLAYPELRIAIEYEGDHHRERAHFQRDVSRLNRLRAAGWVVLRFTADDVLRHPDRLLADVRQARRERAAS